MPVGEQVRARPEPGASHVAVNAAKAWSAMMRERAELGLITHLTAHELERAGSLTMPGEVGSPARTRRCSSGSPRPVSPARWFARPATRRPPAPSCWIECECVTTATSTGPASPSPAGSSSAAPRRGRLGRDDYLEAVDHLPPDRRLPLSDRWQPTPWDDELANVMAKINVAVHEEAIINVLLADLGKVWTTTREQVSPVSASQRLARVLTRSQLAHQLQQGVMAPLGRSAVHINAASQRVSIFEQEFRFEPHDRADQRGRHQAAHPRAAVTTNGHLEPEQSVDKILSGLPADEGCTAKGHGVTVNPASDNSVRYPQPRTAGAHQIPQVDFEERIRRSNRKQTATHLCPHIDHVGQTTDGSAARIGAS